MTAPAIRGATAPTATLAPTSPAGTQVGDLVIVVTLSSVTSGSVPTHTLQSGWSEWLTRGTTGASRPGCLSVAAKVATVAGASAYQAYTSTATNFVSGIIVIEGGTSASSPFAAATAARGVDFFTTPDPPAVIGLPADTLVLAIGAWTLTAAGFNAVTAPTNYTETWEIAGSDDLELSCATRVLSASTASEDPANFTGAGGSLANALAATVALVAPTIRQSVLGSRLIGSPIVRGLA